MAWQFGIAANTVVALMYAAIAALLLRSLRTSGASWQDNPAGWSVVLIFTTCSLGHAAHLTHLLGVPGLSGPLEVIGARGSYDLHLALADVTTAAVATVFWTITVREGRTAAGSTLFDDAPTARRTALAVNEHVVQALAVATYQLDRGDVAAARATVERTLEEARGIASAPFAHGQLHRSDQLVTGSTGSAP